MSETATQMPNEVASLLIPLGDGSMLVPNTNVAEIVPFLEPESVEGKPDWLLGMINWRDLSLPCISFEQCSSGLDDRTFKKERIAIFNTVNASGTSAFYALVIRGIPRLVRVVEEDIVDDEGVCSVVEQMKIKLNGESALIPNLVALERVIADAMA